MKVIIFGAGMAGQRSVPIILAQGHEILCFVDNDPNKQGKTITPESVSGGGAEIYL